MAGYSSRSLQEKLGIRPGFRLAFVHPPAGYRRTLGVLPAGVVLLDRPGRDMDLIHVFTVSQADLTSRLPQLSRRIRPDGMIWVSWPKGTSKMKTNLREDIVRAAARDSGLVDVKVCAVDDTWSGLKLVIPRENRPVLRKTR